jgi:heme/copper-type cytochrome/quinol oxidase subunit 2
MSSPQPSVVSLALFWVAVAVCAVAQAAILRAVLSRPRADAEAAPAQSGTPTSVPRTGSPFGELVWAVLPAVALALVFFWTWTTMHDGPASAQPVGVAVPARGLSA